MESAAKAKMKKNGGKVYCKPQCAAAAKSKKDVELTCDCCKVKFILPAREANVRLKQKHVFCTLECYWKYRRNRKRGTYKKNGDLE